MKKLIIFCISAIILCGCSSKEQFNDNIALLTKANWEGNDAQCTNIISFEENGAFSNWCYCGFPVGVGNTAEKFRYHASDQTIHLLDNENEVIETGTIQYIDNMYLIIHLWDRCYVYENLNAEHLIPKACALEYIGTEELSKPYLRILDYKNKTLTVSSYDYDHNVAESFSTWTLPTHKDIVFSEASVTTKNKTETLSISQLTEKDYEHIGETYTTGYIELNAQGEVISVIFYDKTINNFRDTVHYENKTYVNLEYPMNIFTYNFYSNQYFEVDTLYPVAHEQWKLMYFGGDLYVHEEQIENAITYYADDDNYDWFVTIDEEDTEKSIPLSLTTEELEYLYEMEAMDFTLTESMAFHEITQFASIKKRSKDNTVFALISLAQCNDSWYWKTEIMTENDMEYMVKLPDSLNEKLFAIQTK